MWGGKRQSYTDHRPSWRTMRPFRPQCARLLQALCLLSVWAAGVPTASVQAWASGRRAEQKVSGQVVDAAGHSVSGATVRWQCQGGSDALQTITDASGYFTFHGADAGPCTVLAEASGARSDAVITVSPSQGAAQPIRLVLHSLAAGPAPQTDAATKTMAFSDQPNFTVAGVTDWTAVGGHGSDATLRTSEDMARATLALNARSSEADLPVHEGEAALEATLRSALAADPQSYRANKSLGEYYLQTSRFQQAFAPLQTASSLSHGEAVVEYDLALTCQGLQDLKEARLHLQRALAQKDVAQYERLAGALDEELGEPFSAVKHMERAASLGGSEQDYFAWGSELLLHRAVWQAAEIFERGAWIYPKSTRMRTGWGTALFAAARYDEAAQRLCEASDLQPADTEPYLFLGKIDGASPTALPCVQERLSRFLQLQPANATANYIYAMALLRREGETSRARVNAFLLKAIALDPAYSAAYLQLGIAASARRQYPEAIAFYKQAIAADTLQAEAHYRLAVAYDHTGEPDKAKEQRDLHEAMERSRANAVEEERRQVKQFLVVLQQQPANSRQEHSTSK